MTSFNLFVSSPQSPSQTSKQKTKRNRLIFHVSRTTLNKVSYKTLASNAGDVIVDSRPVRKLKARKEWHRGRLQNVVSIDRSDLLLDRSKSCIEVSLVSMDY